MITRIGYMVREIAFENGGITEDNTTLYAHLNDAQQAFNQRATHLCIEYPKVGQSTDRGLSAVSEDGTRDVSLELKPIRMQGFHIGEDEVMDLIISKVSGGTYSVLDEIVLNFGKEENYEHCDEMVLLGVLHEYTDEEDEDGNITKADYYNVHLALHFKEEHDVLNYAENIECVDERVLDKLYEYAANDF